MNHIIDFILVAILFLVTFIAAKRGIILTVFDIASGIIAVLSAKIASPYAAQYIYDSFLKEKVIQYLTTKYSAVESGISEAVNSITSFFDFLPDGVMKYAESSGYFNGNNFSNEILSSITNVSELESMVAKPVLTSLLKILCFAAIALILLCVLRILSRMFSNLVKKSKVTGSVDTVLGGVFGLIKGCVDICILAAVINVISCLSPNLSAYASDSYVCSFVSKLIII